MLKAFSAVANAIRTAVGGLLQVVGPSAGSTRTMTVPDANFTAARTDAAQSFTGTQTLLSNPVLDAGTANGVLYLNGSKAATSGSALTFDGANFATTGGVFAKKVSAIEAASAALGAQLVLHNNASTALGNAVELALLTDAGASPSGIRNARIRVVNENAANGAASMQFWTWNGATDAERARITFTGSFVAGAQAALATTATDGFLYIPTCAGTPTGTPTAITGMAPLVVNTTNNKLYFYSDGSWRDAGP